MKFCSACGALVSQRSSPAAMCYRYVCEQCQAIHYHHPKTVAGCIPEQEDRIFLCWRAIDPRLGFWTFPAGFMEIGETTEEAVAEETKEEALAEVVILLLQAVLSMPKIGWVYTVFRGRMWGPTFGAGTESLEVDLFKREDIPWEKTAFPVVAEALRCYLRNAETGQFPLQLGTVLERYLSQDCGHRSVAISVLIVE